MGQAANQIEAHIEDTRADLGDNLRELEQKVKSATDWKHHYRNNPMTMVGIAFGGGIMLAAMLGGRKHRRPNGQTSGASLKAIETIDTIKNAIIGVAATKVKDFVGDIVPGFHDEMMRCEEQAKATLS